jgi:hypothetical protein
MNRIAPLIVSFLLILVIPALCADLPRVSTTIDKIDIYGNEYKGHYLGCNLG